MLLGTFPPELRRDIESRAGCVAGALEEGEYRRLLADAGFTDVEVQVTRVHDPKELAGSSCCGVDGACGTTAAPAGKGIDEVRAIRDDIRARVVKLMEELGVSASGRADERSPGDAGSRLPHRAAQRRNPPADPCTPRLLDTELQSFPRPRRFGGADERLTGA